MLFGTTLGYVVAIVTASGRAGVLERASRICQEMRLAGISGRVAVKPQYLTLPKHETPRFYGPEACVVTAFDAKTGKEVWRHRTIPKPGEPGDETWGNIPYEQRWHVGMWMVPSYDPTTKRIYVGTSVIAPAPKFMLAGNNNQYLYHNSTLALDVNTGKMIWFFQHVVDHWDLDHPFERLIVDTTLSPDPKSVKWINPSVHQGETRKVITGIPGKTGIVYTLDARHRQVPLGARDDAAERDLEHQRRVGRRDRESRQAVHGAGSGEADLPEHVGRQELSGRHVQPAHGHRCTTRCRTPA